MKFSLGWTLDDRLPIAVDWMMKTRSLLVVNYDIKDTKLQATCVSEVEGYPTARFCSKMDAVRSQLGI
jgi:hypothetical protein